MGHEWDDCVFWLNQWTEIISGMRGNLRMVVFSGKVKRREREIERLRSGLQGIFFFCCFMWCDILNQDRSMKVGQGSIIGSRSQHMANYYLCWFQKRIVSEFWERERETVRQGIWMSSWLDLHSPCHIIWPSLILISLWQCGPKAETKKGTNWPALSFNVHVCIEDKHNISFVLKRTTFDFKVIFSS